MNGQGFSRSRIYEQRRDIFRLPPVLKENNDLRPPFVVMKLDVEGRFAKIDYLYFSYK